MEFKYFAFFFTFFNDNNKSKDENYPSNRHFSGILDRHLSLVLDL